MRIAANNQNNLARTTFSEPMLLMRCFATALIDTEGQMAIDVFYLTSQHQALPHELQKRVEHSLRGELKRGLHSEMPSLLKR
jgi:hypothetical protein